MIVSHYVLHCKGITIIYMLLYCAGYWLVIAVFCGNDGQPVYGEPSAGGRGRPHTQGQGEGSHETKSLINSL